VKITVISVMLNAEPTVGHMMASVASQTHPDVEHLIIDGGSTDGTLDCVRSSAREGYRLVSGPDEGVWDAMNKGLQLATGEVVGFLNADDEFVSVGVLATIAATFDSTGCDACYADLTYVARDDPARVIRRWRSQVFCPGLFAGGWMPAHPTFYARRQVYLDYGGFDLSYPLQADFELTMRLMEKHGIRSAYVPEQWVRMRIGGQSNASLLRVIRGNLEAYRAARHHGLPVSPFFPVRKILSRLPQFWQA
jgi:glycosyltransferase involved in cell wall biosynthesis